MLEVCSYRRVFDLERRIYKIDRLRLNPAGVPVRGVVYYFALLLAVLLLDATPLIGAGVSWMPWYVRAVALPGAGATLLAVVRIDGRPAHLVGWALLRYALEPGCLSRLRPCKPLGARWYPPPLTILPDGSEGQLRELRYSGPGRVTIKAAHELSFGGHRSAGRHARMGRRGQSKLVVVSGAQRGSTVGRARTIVLRRGGLVEVKPRRARGRRGGVVEVKPRRARARRRG
jgi:hypothetical protein